MQNSLKANLCPKTHIITLSSKITSLLLSTSLSHHKTYDLLSTNTLIIMHACMPLPLSVQESHPFTKSHTICQVKFGDSMLENCIIKKLLSLFFLHKMLLFVFFRKNKVSLGEFQHLYNSVISVKAAKVLHCIRMSLPDQLGFGVAHLVILLTTV